MLISLSLSIKNRNYTTIRTHTCENTVLLKISTSAWFAEVDL